MKKDINIYLIRHGETYLNRYKKMQGWSDAPLTPEGKVVARETGEKLKNTEFQMIFTSDLGRTIETAETIMAINVYKDDIVIQKNPSFRESFFGSFEGSYGKEVYGKISERTGIPQEELFKKLDMKSLADETKMVDPTNDAENYDEFWQRIRTGLYEILENPNLTDGNILIVTHGNVIRNLVNYVDSSIPVTVEIYNSSITIINYKNGSFKVKEFNNQ